jgi:hypothetical protein
MTATMRIRVTNAAECFETTLDEFLAANAEGDEDWQALRDAVRRGERYVGGGGAAAWFSVEPAP